jgi:hypothetical protein
MPELMRQSHQSDQSFDQFLVDLCASVSGDPHAELVVVDDKMVSVLCGSHSRLLRLKSNRQDAWASARG